MFHQETNLANEVYGSRIVEVAKDGEIPTFVKSLFAEVEARGLCEQGIYRISGTSNLIQTLKSAIDSG
jgi:hypothetical protein